MLGITWQYLVAFMINFGLLALLLTFVLYKPITKTLDERAAKIKESLEKAEQIKQESIRAEESVKAQIEAGRKEGQAIIAQAQQAAERVKEEAKAEARKEAEALIMKAQAQIESDREEAFNKLRREFADLAVLAAEKVIEQSLDKKAHERLIEKVLEEGLASRKSQLN
ncbi:MAG: F0F1 ATP synthase subunit B [Dehalococcoidia bacterium]|nr:F0F1 ATP synthase subunit B [Dehalococcoidia bacterium]